MRGVRLRALQYVRNAHIPYRCGVIRTFSSTGGRSDEEIDELYRIYGPDGKRKSSNFWTSVEAYEEAKAAEKQQLRAELKEILDEEKAEKDSLKQRLYAKWLSEREQLREGEKRTPEQGKNATKEQANVDRSNTPRDTHFDLGVGVKSPSDLDPLIATLEESLKFLLATAPKASFPVAQSYEELALLCHQKTDFSRAIDYYKRALHVHETLAAANLERDAQRPKPGDETDSVTEPPFIYAKESLEIELPDDCKYSFKTVSLKGDIEAEEGPTIGSYDVARILGYLGVCFRDAGRLDKAKQLLTAALKMKVAIVGHYHPSVAEALNNLGALAHSEGNFPEVSLAIFQAVDYYEDAIQALIGSKGTDCLKDPHTAMAYFNCGKRKSQPIWEVQFPSFAGLAYYSSGNPGQALGQYERALRIAGSVLGEEHDVYTRIKEQADIAKQTLERTCSENETVP